MFYKNYLPVYKTKVNDWERILLSNIKHNKIGGTDFTIEFEYLVDYDKCYFCLTYPYKLKKIDNFITNLFEKKNKEIYFKREVLTRSLENRPIELLTITNKNKKNLEIDEIIDDNLFLFSESNKNQLEINKNNLNYNNFCNYDKKRPFFFKNKKYILISSRVHPGETASSFILEGILNNLFSYNNYIKKLWENFVFLIIPCLNPDGVYNGLYRTDINGLNLNRYYFDPNFETNPMNYAVDKLADHLSKNKVFYMYLDLHAHANNRYSFTFGNFINNFNHHVENKLFAKIMELENPYFNYNKSNFSAKEMMIKNKNDDISKLGCARVIMYKKYNVIRSYTLECHYNVCSIQKEFNDLNLKDKNILIDNSLEKYPKYKENFHIFNKLDYIKIGEDSINSIIIMNKLKKVKKFLALENLKNHLSSIILRESPFRYNKNVRKILISISKKEYEICYEFLENNNLILDFN